MEGGLLLGYGGFVGASFFFVVVVVPTRAEISFFQPAWGGFVKPGRTYNTGEAQTDAMAEDQYQDEDRSAAKTLWLGDVQVRAMIFGPLPKDLALVVSAACWRAWVSEQAEHNSSPPQLRWTTNGCSTPGFPCSLSAAVAAAVGSKAGWFSVHSV